MDVVDKIIKHAKVLYRDDKIEFDIKYLLGFDNCVYDPETYKFRDYSMMITYVSLMDLNGENQLKKQKE